MHQPYVEPTAEDGVREVLRSLLKRGDETDRSLLVTYSTFRQTGGQYGTCIRRPGGYDFDYDGTYVNDPADLAPGVTEGLERMGLRVTGRNLVGGAYSLIIDNPFLIPDEGTPFWEKYQEHVEEEYQAFLQRTMRQLHASADPSVVKLPARMRAHLEAFRKALAARYQIEPVTSDPLTTLVHARP